MEQTTPSRTLDELAENYDVHDPEIQRCHFEVLAHMRKQAPVHRAETYGGYWVVVGFAEVLAAAQDAKRFSSASGVVLGGDKPQKFKPVELDPPEHRPWRRLMTPFFTQHAADGILAPMREFANSLIDGFAATGRTELMDSYAKPLENFAFFQLLMNFSDDETAECVEGINEAMFADDFDTRMRGWGRLQAFGSELWDQRSGRSSDGGLVDTIRTSAIDGQAVTKDEFVGAIMLLISGGSDTTPFAIGNLCIHLAEHPDLRRRVSMDPALLHDAIDESLRHQSPAVTITRTLTHDMEFGGRQMRAGDKAILMWASGNRDENVYPNPDAFDIDRETRIHNLAFGAGVHRCIGERLARGVMFVAAECLLARIPDFELDRTQDITYRMGQSRGPARVPIVFASPVR